MIINIIKLIVVAALVVFLALRYRARAAAIAEQASPVELPTASTDTSARNDPSRRQKKTGEKTPSTRLQRVRPRMRVPIPDGADTVEPHAHTASDTPSAAGADGASDGTVLNERAMHSADGDNATTLDAIVPASGWPDPVGYTGAVIEVSTSDVDEIDIADAAGGADAGWAEIDMNEVGMDDALVTMPSTPPAQEWAEDDGFDPASGWSDDPSSTDTSWSSGGSGGTPPRDEAEWADDAQDTPDSERPTWDMLNAQAWQPEEPVAEVTTDDDQEPSWDVSDWATPEPEAAEQSTGELPDASEPTQDIPVIASAIDDGLPTIASEPPALDVVAEASDEKAHAIESVADAVEMTPADVTADEPIASSTDEPSVTMPSFEMATDEVAVALPVPADLEVEEPTADLVGDHELIDEPIVDAPVAEADVIETITADVVDEPVPTAAFDAPIAHAPVALEPTPLAPVEAPFIDVPAADEQFAVAHFDDTPPPAPVEVPSIEVAANHVTWEVEEPDPLAPAPISQEWTTPAIAMEADEASRSVLPVSTDPTAPVIMYLQSGEQEMKVVIERDHTGNPLAWVLSGVAKVDAEGSAIRVRIPSPDAEDEITTIDVGSPAGVDGADLTAGDAVGEEPTGETFDVVVEVHATDTPQAVAVTPSEERSAADSVADASALEAPHVAAADPAVDEPDTAGLGALAFDDAGINPVEDDPVAAVASTHPAVDVTPEPDAAATLMADDVVDVPVTPPAPAPVHAPMDPIVVALLDRLADTERALVELSTRDIDESKPSSKKPKRKQARKRARAGASAQMHGAFDDDVPEMTTNDDSRRTSESGKPSDRGATRPAPGTAARAIMAAPSVADRDTDAPAPRDTRPRLKKRDERTPTTTVDTRSAPKPMPVMVDADNPLDIAALVQAEANRRVAEVLAQHGSVKTNGDFSGLVDRLEHVLDDDSQSKA